MLFYKIDVEFEKCCDDENNRRFADDIQWKTDKYSKNCGRQELLFVSCASKNKMTIGAAVLSELDLRNDRESFYAMVENYLKAIDIQGKVVEITEITLSTFKHLVRLGYRRDFLESESDILNELNIENTGNTNTYEEKMIDGTKSREKLIEEADGCFCKADLKEELERIDRGGGLGVCIYHPVHYIVQTSAAESSDEVIDILLSSLYNNFRIRSKRYTEIFLDKTSYFNFEKIKEAIKASQNATVVVSCIADCEQDGNRISSKRTAMQELCGFINDCCSNVLVIFKLGMECNNTKKILTDTSPAITFVEIKEQPVFEEDAKDYLERLAQKNSLEADEALLGEVAEKGRSYSAGEIRLIFDLWFEKKIKTDIFPQYNQFLTAAKKDAGEKPKGSAYDNLMGMVGLKPVKRVINRAINYYKVQKLLAANGLKNDNVAMHMVFTGNPGTAKTTAARLLAQILRDNDILSVGDLYELGRADLVGRFVGWTAQIVKDKFKKAKGSVLFIDEAYSLVDGSNSFGDEAINTIVQEMENNREDMVVIFAGYPKEMEGLLNKNPGLASRIAYKINFDDYSPEELFEIVELMVKNMEMRLDKGVEKKIMPMLRQAVTIDGFGNGRYARNILEKAKMAQADRLMKMGVDNINAQEITLLKAEDFILEDTPLTENRVRANPIGFVV